MPPAVHAPSPPHLHAAPQGAPERDYARLDADLVSWHGNMAALMARVESMAIVGLMSNTDSGLELEFNRQAGSERRKLKVQFHAPRDGALAAYLALTFAAHFSRSLPLAALVSSLSCLNLLVLARLKGGWVAG